MFQRLSNNLLTIFQLREHAAHFLDECLDKCAEERFFTRESELATITHRAAEDAAEDVVSAVVAGHDAIGDGEGKGAQVIRDDTEGDGGFHFFRKRRAICAEFRIDVDVGFSTQFFEFAEDGLENVGGVVGRFFREVGEAFGVLNDRASALKTHSGIDVFGGKLAERAIGLGVILNENKVPYFDA